MHSEPEPEHMLELGDLLKHIPILGNVLGNMPGVGSLPSRDADDCDTAARKPSGHPQTKKAACRAKPQQRTDEHANHNEHDEHANRNEHDEHANHNDHDDHTDHYDHIDRQHPHDRERADEHKDRPRDNPKINHQRQAHLQLGLGGLLRHVLGVGGGGGGGDRDRKRKKNVKVAYTKAHRNEKTAKGPNGAPTNHQETLQALHASVSSSTGLAAKLDRVPVTITHPDTAGPSQNQHSIANQGKPQAAISLSKFVHNLPPDVLANALAHARAPGSPFTLNFPTTENIPSTITLKLPSQGKSKPIINLVLHIVPQGHKMTTATSQPHSMAVPPPAADVPLQLPLMPIRLSAGQASVPHRNGQIIRETTTQKSFQSSSKSNISLVNFKANHGLSKLTNEY